MSDIAAIRIVSLSELYAADKKFTEMYAMQLENEKELMQVLYDAGIDLNQPWEHQFNQHRNNFNEVYTGSRWVGLERIDQAWLQSGVASREAIDKAKGNKLLIDLYRSKGLTTDRLGGVFEPEDFEQEETNVVGFDKQENSETVFDKQERQEGIEDAIARN